MDSDHKLMAICAVCATIILSVGVVCNCLKPNKTAANPATSQPAVQAEGGGK